MIVAPEGLHTVDKVELNNVAQHLATRNKAALGRGKRLLHNKHNTQSNNGSDMFVINVVKT